MILRHEKIFDEVTEAGSVTLDNPGGTRVLVTHIISGQTGGYCTLSHYPDGATKVAHQGGNDAVNAKSQNTTTSYAATYYNVGKQFVVDLEYGGGTHTVYVTILD